MLLYLYVIIQIYIYIIIYICYGLLYIYIYICCWLYIYICYYIYIWYIYIYMLLCICICIGTYVAWKWWYFNMFLKVSSKNESLSRQFFKPLPSKNNLKVVSARVIGAVISHTKGPPNYDLAYNHLLKHMYIHIYIYNIYIYIYISTVCTALPIVMNQLTYPGVALPVVVVVVTPTPWPIQGSPEMFEGRSNRIQWRWLQFTFCSYGHKNQL